VSSGENAVLLLISVLSENTRVALQLIDLLEANPFLTPRGVEQKMGLAYNTVMRAIGQLQEDGVITAVTEARRDRVFCAKPLLGILEEPARLTLSEPSRPGCQVGVSSRPTRGSSFLAILG